MSCENREKRIISSIVFPSYPHKSVLQITEKSLCSEGQNIILAKFNRYFYLKNKCLIILSQNVLQFVIKIFQNYLITLKREKFNTANNQNKYAAILIKNKKSPSLVACFHAMKFVVIQRLYMIFYMLSSFRTWVITTSYPL